MDVKDVSKTKGPEYSQSDENNFSVNIFLKNIRIYS